jgi:hypothetical protein
MLITELPIDPVLEANRQHAKDSMWQIMWYTIDRRLQGLGNGLRIDRRISKLTQTL